LDLTAGDVVRLALADDAPGHWVTAVWELACWQVGAEVAVGQADAPAVVVTGPDWSAYADVAADVVACSLHPLGLPFAQPLRPPVLDYTLEVRGQADVYGPVPQPDTLSAWTDDERRLSQGALVEGPWPAPGRRLVRPDRPWWTAHAAVVTPLLTGGSAVVVAGPVDEGQLTRIRRDERVSG
jgi:uncharacterized protein (TIGR03089 family)